MRKKQQRGRGDEYEGATRRKEPRGGRYYEEGAARTKERERSLVYPFSNEKMKKLEEKEKKIE